MSHWTHQVNASFTPQHRPVGKPGWLFVSCHPSSVLKVRSINRDIPLYQRKLFSPSDLKSVDFHPTELWLITGLYNGSVNIYNHQNSAIVKTFEVSQVPVRCVRFIPRKNSSVTGLDFQLRVFNYNTRDKVVAFEAHPDYIRCLAVHPTHPLVFTGSDNMTIKSWDWDKSWKCANVSPLTCNSYDILRLLLS